MVAKCRAAGANPRRFFWGIGAVLALGVMMTAATNGARAEGRPMTRDDFFQNTKGHRISLRTDFMSMLCLLSVSYGVNIR